MGQIKRDTGQKCEKCGGRLVYWVDIDARSESEIMCEDCPTEWDRAQSRIRELEAEVQLQAGIIGRSIDDHDKLVMEKRGMETERDTANAKLRAVGEWAEYANENEGKAHLSDLFDILSADLPPCQGCEDLRQSLAWAAIAWDEFSDRTKPEYLAESRPARERREILRDRLNSALSPEPKPERE